MQAEEFIENVRTLGSELSGLYFDWDRKKLTSSLHLGGPQESVHNYLMLVTSDPDDKYYNPSRFAYCLPGAIAMLSSPKSYGLVDFDYRKEIKILQNALNKFTQFMRPEVKQIFNQMAEVLKETHIAYAELAQRATIGGISPVTSIEIAIAALSDSELRYQFKDNAFKEKVSYSNFEIVKTRVNIAIKDVKELADQVKDTINKITPVNLGVTIKSDIPIDYFLHKKIAALDGLDVSGRAAWIKISDNLKHAVSIMDKRESIASDCKLPNMQTPRNAQDVSIIALLERLLKPKSPNIAKL